MNLRELIEKASADLSQYKHPDVADVKQRLHEILQAAELGGIAGDKLDSLEIYGDEVHIETSWSARCCVNPSSYRIPVSIIDAEDPVREATIYGLKEKLRSDSHELKSAQESVKRYSEKIAEIQGKLSAIFGDAHPQAAKANDNDDEGTDYECNECGKLNYRPHDCGNCGLEYSEAAQAKGGEDA